MIEFAKPERVLDKVWIVDAHLSTNGEIVGGQDPMGTIKAYPGRTFAPRLFDDWAAHWGGQHVKIIPIDGIPIEGGGRWRFLYRVDRSWDVEKLGGLGRWSDFYLTTAPVHLVIE